MSWTLGPSAIYGEINGLFHFNFLLAERFPSDQKPSETLINSIERILRSGRSTSPRLQLDLHPHMR